MACRPGFAGGDHVAWQVVDEHALGRHYAGGIHEMPVDRGLGLEQQDPAGDDMVPEVAEESISFNENVERGVGHVGQQVEMNPARGQLLEKLNGGINGAQRFRGGAQDPAHFLGRAARELREMRGRARFSNGAAIVLVPVGVLEDVLADFGLDRGVRVQLCDHTRRVPLEQHTTGIKHDVSDHDQRLNGDGPRLPAIGDCPHFQVFIGIGTGMSRVGMGATTGDDRPVTRSSIFTAPPLMKLLLAEAPIRQE
jgi:hypothetical protein